MITERGLEGLKQLTELRELTLSLLRVQIRTMSVLRGLVHPDSLSLFLEDTAITDAGLKQLTGLKSLRRLTVEGTAITDSGLEALKAIRSLNELEVLGEPALHGGVGNCAVRCQRSTSLLLKNDNATITCDALPTNLQYDSSETLREYGTVF